MRASQPATSYRGFKISQGYLRLTVWCFNQKTKALLGTFVHVPFRELSRRQKYNVLRKHLKKLHHLPCPPYEKLEKNKK